MATWSEIKDVRLLVNDPPGFVEIVSVADRDALPTVPEQQACYYLADAEKYVATLKENGALPDDYETQRIRISDTRISALIDALGSDAARCRVLRLIATKLGADMQLASTSMGGDSADYTSLRDMFAYYRGLAEQCEEEASSAAANSSGRVGHTDDPQIAGGLV